MEVTWYTVSELIARPELLAAPELVLPHLAWRGRLTLVSAVPKHGKSTLIRQGVAAKVTGAPFLEETIRSGRVGMLCLDEPLGDLVRSLYDQGVRGGVLVREDRPGLEELEETIAGESIELLVIDTLSEFCTGLVDSMNDTAQSAPIMSALRGIARRTECAIVVIHHLNKAGTSSAGSLQWEAGADVIVTMRQAEDVATRRVCRARGRGVFEDFVLDWSGDDGYSLASGELSLDLRVYKAIEGNPGASLRLLRQQVGGRNKDMAAALRGLALRGEVVNLGDDERAKWFVRSASVQNGGNHSGTTREPLHATG